jgi:hypothetical protein
MAKKLYEETNIANIANQIRRTTGQYAKKFTVARMANAIQDVYDIGYENGELKGSNEGYEAGLVAGAEKVKTEEARDNRNIAYDVYSKEVEVNVEAGYYPQEAVVKVDVTSVYDEGHTEGYNEGYDDGIAAGGGGGNNEELEEMILNGDENYDDEGKEFYNVYKWIDVWNSSLSSVPVVISAMNRHPTLWMHAYFRLLDSQGGYYGYRSMAIPPDDGENSMEIDMPLENYVLEGVRWSENGI